MTFEDFRLKTKGLPGGGGLVVGIGLAPETERDSIGSGKGMRVGVC